MNYESTGGFLSAFANNYINLNEASGNIDINVISNAGKSDVKLTSAGSIIDANASENPNIYSKGISLNAKAGSIGLYSDDIDIYSNYKTNWWYINCTGYRIY